jgi:hypothetical protein
MKILVGLLSTIISFSAYSKTIVASCEETYSYFGGYYLTAEIKDNTEAIVSYGRNKGPDGDGELIEEQAFDAKVKPSLRPNSTILLISNGNSLELDFNRLAAQLILPQEEISLDCVLKEK